MVANAAEIAVRQKALATPSFPDHRVRWYYVHVQNFVNKFLGNYAFLIEYFL